MKLNVHNKNWPEGPLLCCAFLPAMVEIRVNASCFDLCTRECSTRWRILWVIIRWPADIHIWLIGRQGEYIENIQQSHLSFVATLEFAIIDEVSVADERLRRNTCFWLQAELLIHEFALFVHKFTLLSERRRSHAINEFCFTASKVKISEQKQTFNDNSRLSKESVYCSLGQYDLNGCSHLISTKKKEKLYMSRHSS